MEKDQPASANAPQIAFWNSPATRAWADHHDRIDRLLAPTTDIVLAAAAPAPGERILDIGCGSGTTALALAERVGSAGRVLGVDVAERSVARANGRLAAAGLDQAKAVVADAGTWDFPAGEFDLAFSRFGTMFFIDPVAAFGNIRKALRPGGRLVAAVFRKPRENPWATAAVYALRHLLPDLETPGPEEPGQFSWADPARVHRILEGAGFHSVELTPHDPAIRLAGDGGAAEAAAGALLVGPFARAAIDATPARKEEMRAALEHFFRQHEKADGIVLPGAIWIVRATA